MTLTVLVLTRDEAQHIERCVASVAGLAARIVVVDSGSTDATVALAKTAGAEVYANPWVNHAAQINWALDHCGIDTPWTMRLDADEVVLAGLRTQLAAFLAEPGEAAAATVNRQIHFLGRWMRWGGVYPVRQLRVWRTGRGRCEDRWMDEHIAVDGPIRHLDADIADINLNTIGWWTAKHNGYATLEAIETLLHRADANVHAAGQLDRQARVKRWIKHSVYGRMPLGLRALVYFLYRYVVRLGFLDGWQGLVFNGLQGGWYRFLVDAKVAELRQLMAVRQQDLATVVAAVYGIHLK